MRILSGIQPSGVLHIGNYFGMMRPAIALQAEGEALYFIADYHALTSLRDPEALRETVGASRSIFWRADSIRSGQRFFGIQMCRRSPNWRGYYLRWRPWVCSSALIHTKTNWHAACLPTVGLFNYPVLMAADILIYDSDVVPVGKDQKQHIEMTRDLAVKMNETFGQVFKLPEARIQAATETVPGIDGQKMSKSYGNNIDIFGDEKETRKRVMSIVTDSTPIEAPKDPERSTIVQLYSLFASKDELANMKEQFKKGGTGYGDFKKELFEKLWEYFAPMRKRREEILRDKSYIDDVLARGAKHANEIADQVMKRVRNAIGLR